MSAHDVLLSICIPTFERSALLEQSLRSILGQFPEDAVEIVVLDNASTDQTREVVEAAQGQHRCVRYIRNDVNIGLDRNAIRAIDEARGEYVFLFSDDDVLLPGSGAAILAAIASVRPSFLYLGHAGFWVDEPLETVVARQAELHTPDRVYRQGFELLYDALLEHNSAMIFRTSAVRHALRRLAAYDGARFERGYAVSALGYLVVLEADGPFVRLGHCSIAVRNLPEQSYNPIYSSHIDVVRQYQMLRAWGLLTRAQLAKLMKKRIWGVRDNLILALRCARDPRYGVAERNLIWRQNWRYWRFYLYLAPIVTLPRWIVCPAYRLGQMVLRRYERSRGIERRVLGAP